MYDCKWFYEISRPEFGSYLTSTMVPKSESGKPLITGHGQEVSSPPPFWAYLCNLHYLLSVSPWVTGKPVPGRLSNSANEFTIIAMTAWAHCQHQVAFLGISFRWLKIGRLYFQAVLLVEGYLERNLFIYQKIVENHCTVLNGSLSIANWHHVTLFIATWRHEMLSIVTWRHATFSIATWRHNTFSIATWQTHF